MNKSNLFCFAGLLLISATTFSQPGKKDFMLAIEPFYGNDTRGFSYAAGFNVSASYFLTPRLSAGLTIPYCYSNMYKPGSFGTQKEINAVLIGPSLRYYFAGASRWKIYSQFDYTFGRQVAYLDDDSSDPETVKSSSASGRVGVGGKFFVKKRFGLSSLISLYWVGGPSATAGFTSYSLGCNFFL